MQIIVALSLPLRTCVGTKYHETVKTDTGCERCPYLMQCHQDVVNRGGFAWCEDAIPVDLVPSGKTAAR